MLKMSDVEKQSVQYLVDWIKNGGVSQWIEHLLASGDEAKLRQIKEIYDRIKTIFGF